METQRHTNQDGMVKETVLKEDGRYLYLYTFPTDTEGDTADTDLPDEAPEDPYV